LVLPRSLFRLKGDKEARGIAAAPIVEMTEAEKKKNKNKKKVASTAVKLEDEMVKEIEFVLAQVSSPPPTFDASIRSSLLILRGEPILMLLFCSVSCTQIDNYNGKQLGELIRRFKIVNPDTQNEVTEPEEFNLMFGSSIGPTGQVKGCVASFLRLSVSSSSRRSS